MTFNIFCSFFQWLKWIKTTKKKPMKPQRTISLSLCFFWGGGFFEGLQKQEFKKKQKTSFPMCGWKHGSMVWGGLDTIYQSVSLFRPLIMKHMWGNQIPCIFKYLQISIDYWSAQIFAYTICFFSTTQGSLLWQDFFLTDFYRLCCKFIMYVLRSKAPKDLAPRRFFVEPLVTPQSYVLTGYAANSSFCSSVITWVMKRVPATCREDQPRTILSLMISMTRCTLHGKRSWCKTIKAWVQLFAKLHDPNWVRDCR